MFNKNGFTFVEVMIAVAMMATMSMVFMAQTKNTTKANAKVVYDSETALITNEIIQILADPIKCMSTFGPAGSKSGLSSTVTNIFNRFYTVASGLSPNNGYANGHLTINSYSLTSTSADLAANFAKLTILFNNKNILGGNATKPKIIDMFVTVDGSSNIIGCRSLSNAHTDIWSRGSGSEIYYSGGNVGVGVLTPAENLSVYSATTSNFSVANSAHKFYAGASSAQPWIGTETSSDLRVVTNGTEKMRITSTGNVGVGVLAPAENLSVYSATTSNFSVANSAHKFYAGASSAQPWIGTETSSDLRVVTNGSEKMRITSGGNVGIGSSSPGFKLDVDGTINSTSTISGATISTPGTSYAASFQYTSDRRLKTAISPLENSIDKILKLRPVKFRWKKDQEKDQKGNQKEDYGFIAQEVREVIPEITSFDDHKVLHVDYAKIIPFLVATIQQQQREINSLKKRK